MRTSLGNKLNELVTREHIRLQGIESKLLRQLDDVRNELHDLRREVEDIDYNLANPPIPEMKAVKVNELKAMYKIDAIKAIRECKLELLEAKKLIEREGWYRERDIINIPTQLDTNSSSSSS